MTKYAQTKPIVTGIEDRFHYVISDDCIACGSCATHCPTKAISKQQNKYHIDAQQCIDCGTCAAVCLTGAAQPLPVLRESIDIQSIDKNRCYFNAGCAMSVYKPELVTRMHALLQQYWGNAKLHTICCRHNPQLEEGSTIINNCAGCDRRFRSLYKGINTISFWEVLDSIPDLPLPDHSGLTVSVHDSCGYRQKPQVHRAVRSLLGKMHINIVEAEKSGTQSVCCGDNFYGIVPHEQVETRIRMRAEQLPCYDVVVYCIGCVRAMTFGGKRTHYLPDLLFARSTAPMLTTLDDYHSSLTDYIHAH